MDAPVYRIAKWSTTFETSDSRKHKQLAWVSLPIDRQSNGYQSMIDSFPEDAPAIYGAWCVLVGIAAGCPIRGTLANSKGDPLTIERIARLSHMPADVFERLFEWAIREEIGWLELVTDRQSVDDRSSTDCQPVDERPLTALPNKPNPTNPTKPKSGKAATFDPSKIQLPDTLDTPEFREAWSDWIKHRREKRKPLTKTSAEKQVQRFATWGPQRSVAAINHTIEKTWDGIREPDTKEARSAPIERQRRSFAEANA